MNIYIKKKLPVKPIYNDYKIILGQVTDLSLEGCLKLTRDNNVKPCNTFIRCIEYEEAILVHFDLKRWEKAKEKYNIAYKKVEEYNEKYKKEIRAYSTFLKNAQET